jgi:hypothetical protein
MGIVALVLVIVAGIVFLLRMALQQFVCPFCGGPIKRAFKKMRCTQCGRLFFLWQANRK